MRVFVQCAECLADIEVDHDCSEVIAERCREDMPDAESDRDRQYDAEEREPALD